MFALLKLISLGFWIICLSSVVRTASGSKSEMTEELMFCGNLHLLFSMYVSAYEISISVYDFFMRLCVCVYLNAHLLAVCVYPLYALKL